MGYIDILGFLADNRELLDPEYRYVDAEGNWWPKTPPAAIERDTITSLSLYLPPMHAIVLKKKVAATTLTVTLNTNRIVTDASQIARPLPAPAPAPRKSQTADDHGSADRQNSQLNKGIMTITAVNPASKRCTSRLLLGQGFNEAIISGEDAVLTTVNIDNYSNTSHPATPFNIYAVEGTSGLSIDLRDEIVNVPISFYNSELPFEPNSYLWFTGVNNIDGELVLYDTLSGTERPIIDGICLNIETPEQSHLVRYYIRRSGYNPNDPSNPVTTDVRFYETDEEGAVKIVRKGHVYILRNGHIYTVLGQKVR
jgi:hypothetical protein